MNLILFTVLGRAGYVLVQGHLCLRINMDHDFCELR